MRPCAAGLECHANLVRSAAQQRTGQRRTLCTSHAAAEQAELPVWDPRQYLSRLKAYVVAAEDLFHAALQQLFAICAARRGQIKLPVRERVSCFGCPRATYEMVVVERVELFVAGFGHSGAASLRTAAGGCGGVHGPWVDAAASLDGRALPYCHSAAAIPRDATILGPFFA